MGRRPVFEADVCVVGAGIVGLAHALEARARGLRVVILDRGTRAVGASVRNFGHGALAAMADGLALRCALDARGRWLDLAARTGLELTSAGTLLVARHEDELAVIEAVVKDGRRGAVLLSPRQVAQLAPIPGGDLVGGLHARLDYRVNPRRAVGLLATLLERDPDALVLWEAAVHGVASGTVTSSQGVVRAPLVILCPGPEFDSLPADVRPRTRALTKCKLQMLRVAAPDAQSYEPALMTGLSLIRYPGFAAAPGAAVLQARLMREEPELLAAGIHLIVTQLPDGDLIIGDSHEYGTTLSPFAEERVFELLLEQAQRLLGADHLAVRQRWLGIYPTAPGDPFLIEEPIPGVWIAEVVSGIGMTTALGFAPRVLDALLGGDNADPDLKLWRADEPLPPHGSPLRSEAAGAGYGS